MKRSIIPTLLLLTMAGHSIAQTPQTQIIRKQELVNLQTRKVDSLENVLQQYEDRNASSQEIRKVQKELNRSRQRLQKAERDLKRAQEKAAGDAWDARSYQKALQAIEEQQFVLEAEQVVFKRGESVYVTSTTNFILLDQKDATVQTSFSTVNPGPNGLGGITLDGRISNLKKETDKKGNTTLSFNIQGVGISAAVRIKLSQGNPRATAYIEPNFNSNTLTLYGRIVPLDQSEVYKGRAL